MVDNSDSGLSRRRILRGAAAAGLGSALPTGTPVAADPSSDGKPDLDEIGPERFDADEAVVRYEQVATRTGAETRVDIIRPDIEEPVSTIPALSISRVIETFAADLCDANR